MPRIGEAFQGRIGSKKITFSFKGYFLFITKQGSLIYGDNILS